MFFFSFKDLLLRNFNLFYLVSRGKQREQMLDGLTKWPKVGRVTEALKMTRDRYAMEGHDHLG